MEIANYYSTYLKSVIDEDYHNLNTKKLKIGIESLKLPSEDFVNLIGRTSGSDIFSVSESIASSSFYRKDLLKAVKNSPFYAFINRDMRGLKLRLKDSRSISAVVKCLRGYYQDLYTSWNKMIGGSHEKSTLYVSAKAVQHQKYTQKITKRFLDKRIYIRDGNTVVAVKLSEVCMSDQDKINDIYSDMLVIQKIAEKKKLEQVLLTFTAIPHFHANPTTTNCSYKGHSRLEALKFIQQEVYRPLYKRLHLIGIKPIGFSVPEPHKDGCPHIHAGWFIPKKKMDDFIKTVNDIKGEIAEKYDLNAYQLDIKLKKDLADDKRAATAASYTLKYVIKSFNDPVIAAWYSRDNGGEIRRCNRLGLSSFKTKFNFLYKIREKLAESSDPKAKELGIMLCKDKKELELSDKKLNFIENYSDFIESQYDKKINRFGEPVSYFSHVCFFSKQDDKDEGESKYSAIHLCKTGEVVKESDRNYSFISEKFDNLISINRSKLNSFYELSLLKDKFEEDNKEALKNENLDDKCLKEYEEILKKHKELNNDQVIINNYKAYKEYRELKELESTLFEDNMTSFQSAALTINLCYSRKSVEDKSGFNIKDDTLFSEDFDDFEEFYKTNPDLLKKEKQIKVDFDIF